MAFLSFPCFFWLVYREALVLWERPVLMSVVNNSLEVLVVHLKHCICFVLSRELAPRRLVS